MISKQIIVVEGVSGINPNQLTERLILFDENGVPFDFSGSTPQTGANVFLTGYVPEEDYVVEATDTVNEAIAKIEAEIVSLKARVTDLEG